MKSLGIAGQQLAKLSIILLLIIIASCARQTTRAEAAGSLREEPSVIKVLLVKNSDGQHELERASSLSLERNEDSNNTLASLHLHQREPVDERQWVSKITSPGATNQRLPGGRWPRSQEDQQQQQQQQSSSSPSGDLAEMQLTRFKPTWFNVSSMFKISGASEVEMLKYMIPPRYYLRQAFDSPVLLKTKLGILEGVRSIKFNKDLYTFLSVPYAKAPVAELRFKAPEPIEKWDGVLQATKWPPFCVQQSLTLASGSSPVHILSRIMSEDCLYLNIWTPSLKFNKNHKRPVMVWLHGGAFQYGGISVDENDGSALALLGDVVVVTLNYRLTAFGFLNAQNAQNGPNNAGLLDQRQALQWVQENIRQFGGDPQQVTLFGESAGGHSVGLHLISPASYNLFKRVIFQSGVPITQLKSYDSNPDTNGNRTEGIGGYMMAKRLNCIKETPTPTTTTTTEASVASNGGESSSGEAGGDSTNGETNDHKNGDSSAEETEGPEFIALSDEILACMRTKSSLEVIRAMGPAGNSGYFPTGRDPKGFLPNGSIVKSFDADQPQIGPQKDILIGTNGNEGTFMLHYALPSVFPAKSLPKVFDFKSLKREFERFLNRLTDTQTKSYTNATSADVGADSMSTAESTQGGTQVHLYSPLLTTSTTILENLMPKIDNLTSDEAKSMFGKHVGNLIGDVLFLCPSRSLAQTLAEQGRNVYFYLFEHRSSRNRFHEWFGVTHHDEVEFVFGRPLRMADVFSGKDIEMSQRLIKTWSHFAYTGQPLDQLGLKWPQYGVSQGNFMRLKAEGAEVGQNHHDKMCNMFDSVMRIHLDEE